MGGIFFQKNTPSPINRKTAKQALPLNRPRKIRKSDSQQCLQTFTDKLLTMRFVRFCQLPSVAVRHIKTE